MGDQVSLFADAIVLIPRWSDTPPPRVLGHEWHRVHRLNAHQWLTEDRKTMQLEGTESEP